MAIQSAINKMIGTAAAGVAAATKLQEGKEALEIEKEKGLKAKEEYHVASAELESLKSQAADLTKVIETSNETIKSLENKKPGGKGNTKASIEEKRNKALDDKKAAERAFSQLQDKIAAKMAIQERTASIMNRTLGGKE